MTDSKLQNNLLVHLDFQENAINFKKPVPIRFQIKGVELFGNRFKDEKGDPWLKGWVHLFATQGLYMLWASRNIKEGTGITIDKYEATILFKTTDDSVLVYSDQVNESVEINYDILFSTWQQFGQRVHKVFVQRHPEMSTYPWWDILYNLPKFISVLATNPDWFNKPNPYWYENDDT